MTTKGIIQAVTQFYQMSQFTHKKIGTSWQLSNQKDGHWITFVKAIT